MRHLLPALVLLFSLPLQADEQAEEQAGFWAWFGSAAAGIDVASPGPGVQADMRYWLDRISPDLSYEIRRSGRKGVLTLSADGREALVPLIDSLVRQAPQIDGWKIESLRQKEREPRSVSVGDVTLDPDDLFFDLYDDGARFGVVFYVPGFVQEQLGDYRLAAMRLMSMSVGEREVAGRIGFVEFDRKGVRDLEFSRPFREFAAVFEGLHK